MTKIILTASILCFMLPFAQIHAQRTDTTKPPKSMGIDTMRDVRGMDIQAPSMRDRKESGTQKDTIPRNRSGKGAGIDKSPGSTKGGTQKKKEGK